MKLSELINDLITATVKHEDKDVEVEIAELEEPTIIIHDDKVIIGDAIHG